MAGIYRPIADRNFPCWRKLAGSGPYTIRGRAVRRWFRNLPTVLHDATAGWNSSGDESLGRYPCAYSKSSTPKFWFVLLLACQGAGLDPRRRCYRA